MKTFALSLALLASAPALAQTAAAPQIVSGMTLAQFVARQEPRFMAADTDGDGRISLAEFEAASKGRGDPSRRFARIDSNKDGFLDKAEISAMLERRFHHLDANGDGVLTAQERSAARIRHSPVHQAGE